MKRFLPIFLLFFLCGWTPIDLAHNTAALNAARSNRWQEAEKELAAALRTSGDHRLLYNYGSALYQLGDFEKAEKAFREAARRAPRDLKVRYGLGNCLYRLGQKKESEKYWKEAIAEYRAALSLDPRDEDARFNLAFVEAKMKKKGSRKEEKKSEIGEAEVNEALGMLEQDERQRQAQAELKSEKNERSDGVPKLQDLWSPSEPDW